MQQLARFGLTHGVARSVCGSKASGLLLTSLRVQKRSCSVRVRHMLKISLLPYLHSLSSQLDLGLQISTIHVEFLRQKL